MAILPAQTLTTLINDGGIQLGGPLGPRQLQPASLDLTFGARAWRVRASFLPAPGSSIADRLKDGLEMHELNLTDGAVLEKGCVYLVELRERLALPPSISGAANPKSSTGRIDVFVRLITEPAVDRRPAFDEIPAGYTGPLYAEVSPRTFSILVRTGSSLNQMRLKSASASLDDATLRALHKATPLVDADGDIDGGLGVSVDLISGTDRIGWRARRHAALIDVDKPGALAPEDYFEPLPPPKSGFIILDPDEFYILASKESLVIPPDCAAEMMPISPGLGEFRVHYAGFFDPGFGWSPEGGAERGESGKSNGSRAVLEVRSHDAPFVLEHGQLVARLVYEKMAARPETLYGDGVRSHYQGQALKLSKHFREID
ncbi:MAG: 2'-deoxycytidine 5'-triphosphate deaminase [Pseudomonadota bacterium]